MPPTPFQPNHRTPFKSTLSSSQQSRQHHTPFCSSPSSTSICISDIVPSEWKYHAEGGKNILLSYSPSCADSSPFCTPGCTYALRIPKSLPLSTDAQQADDQEESSCFTQDIIAPLLGSSSVLPQCITIYIQTARDRDIIETLAARIELERPPARRASPSRIRADQLSCIYAVENVTAFTPSFSGQGVLCVEIKPKWGFLPKLEALPPNSPNVEIKAKFSRFKMHKVLKQQGAMTREEFEQLYDPLDLYSMDHKRMDKAIRALWREWKQTHGKTNNLRLFWNGQMVYPKDTESLKHVAALLGGQDGEEAFVVALVKHLIKELTRPYLFSTEIGQDKDDKEMSLLSRLAYLQSALDPLDVEGLAHLWLHHTQSHTLGQIHVSNSNSNFNSTTSSLPPSLTCALPSSQLYPVLQKFFKPSASSVDVKLEDAVQAFLVSASFKDCSMLIRMNRDQDRVGEKLVVQETKLVDLDRKSWEKLGWMQKTDAEVCATFLKWLETLECLPSASVGL
ncbi:related to Inositol-pentakisphosphate 2-kinase [Melanopsichium pennsylvanicum]|uniref:Inositol-pentakisphosphate 2-kinase n=2 Tax=Melanopsichium pennsylvanicum TaxID=63383 RepID=A0AAJ5C7D0_9BASI|nr:conserved hypothetical protein [Melanopsichium pennsylvanicum 4]SNX86384.1 related to Inositol-pentakisphosphate 2-kinase [Melanopsichium pennsylvanicum]